MSQCIFLEICKIFLDVIIVLSKFVSLPFPSLVPPSDLPLCWAPPLPVPSLGYIPSWALPFPGPPWALSWASPLSAPPFPVLPLPLPSLGLL